MASKRERETNKGLGEEELDAEAKRQRKDEESSPPSAAASVANLLSGDSDDDDSNEPLYGGRRSRQIESRKDCPYLDTVNRQVLDFDFEKFCSVSLLNLNVYAGKNSHAYTHSLEAGHHVYINLRTEKVYCLPDGYEINDPSLDDIRNVLNPRFTPKDVELLDKNKQWSRALDGSSYLPGMVGLNNIKETDFVNVTIQSLIPHEFLQAVMKASKKRFCIGAQSDPVEFMSWLLNTLHADLKSSKNTSIIYDCFQRAYSKFIIRILVSANFPVKNELKDYIPLPTPKENEKLRSKYDLIANVVHDGKPGEAFYRVFVQRKSEELWN
ncbi:U4/U6.U5 tri-snRNP-associated protein [Arachis hypogaea]|nr:U4/U6.U5 tri-snRNP-associated protein [Arachis hypogaea]